MKGERKKSWEYKNRRNACVSAVVDRDEKDDALRLDVTLHSAQKNASSGRNLRSETEPRRKKVRA